MDIDFMVENYRSIKEPVLLSAVAQKRATPQKSDSMSERRTVPDNEIAPAFVAESWDFELLPALAIFGANASGKSNIANALDHLLLFAALGAGTHHEVWSAFFPFMLNANQRFMPTRFEVRVLRETKIYTYTLNLDRERILLERLDYALPSSKRERLLFLREWD